MQLFKNNAYSTLAAGLLVGGTTLVVAAGQGDRFPVVSGSDFCLVTLQDASNNIEIVKVTARASGADSMTIVRAQEGTTARAWNIGDIAELRITSAGLAPLQVFAGATTAADMRAAMDVPTRTGGDASGTWNISISGNAATASSATTAAACSGNAATATTLATARTINGTSFNGSANITTDIWGTERTITIGATGKSVNGSAAVSWSLAEIGAAGASDTVNLTGDQTLAGTKTFSSSPVVPGLNGGQLAGVRNKIINGKMEISQRGTTFVSPVTGSYMLDRWQHQSVNDGAFTVTQNSDVPADNEFQNSLRLTVTTADASIAAGQFCSLRQPIEGYNVRDLIEKTFTLSFRVRSSKTGTHCVALINDAGDRSYVAEYTVNAANTWETKSITVSGGLITAGTWNWTNGRGVILSFAIAAGSTYQTTAGAWQTGNFMATSSQVNCLDTIGNIFAITGVQLEVGSTATPFEHRPYGDELALCQRYYEPGTYSESSGVTNSAIVASVATNTPFKVTKRVNPTVTGTNDQGGTFWATGISVSSVSLGRSNVVANRVNSGTFAADSEL